MTIETWLYNLKGERRQLYSGHSMQRAVKARNVAADVIHVFRLDASVCIIEKNLTERCISQKDYYAGYAGAPVAHERRELKLALDR